MEAQNGLERQMAELSQDLHAQLNAAEIKYEQATAQAASDLADAEKKALESEAESAREVGAMSEKLRLAKESEDGATEQMQIQEKKLEQLEAEFKEADSQAKRRENDLFDGSKEKENEAKAREQTLHEKIAEQAEWIRTTEEDLKSSLLNNVAHMQMIQELRSNGGLLDKEKEERRGWLSNIFARKQAAPEEDLASQFSSANTGHIDVSAETADEQGEATASEPEPEPEPQPKDGNPF